MSLDLLNKLDELNRLLVHKKSKDYYAKKLGITRLQVDYLLNLLNNGEKAEKKVEERVVKFEEDVLNNKGEIVLNTPEEIKSLDDLIEKCKIDVTKWNIDKYVQNYWGNSKTPHWQVKAWLSKKKEHQVFQDQFIAFLENYKPRSLFQDLPPIDDSKNDACLIINKQDAHYNKFDIHQENEVNARFFNIFIKVSTVVEQALLSNNLERIYYVIGSDEFNSEFTNTTTKGTPQQNVLPYHQSFEAICNHEVELITYLLKKCDSLEVIYVPGNHDEYVGWHLIEWLKVYFRGDKRVQFDASPRYRKYVSYGSSAMMFNHGDAMKPVKLAGIFPIEYRDGWSYCDNFYIFTGDKHHELSQDFNGIKFYQIPAFSNAKSSWDEKNGYVGSKGEVTGFLIDVMDGMTNIFKQYL